MKQEWYKEIGAELSPFINTKFDNPAFRSIAWTTILAETPDQLPTISDENTFLYDIIEKILSRGVLPFLDFEIESQLVEVFGSSWSMKQSERGSRGSIEYNYSDDLIEGYGNFTDFVDPWEGDLQLIALDPEHPENERKLLKQLVGLFGDRFIHCLYPQVPLDKVLAIEDAVGFTGQRGDFLICLPNGNRLLIEPGDHREVDQLHLDQLRDSAFRNVGVETLRPENSEIGTEVLADQVRDTLEDLDATQFFMPSAESDEKHLALQYLCLLPSLIAKTEWVLNQALVRYNLFAQKQIKIVVTEQDLWATEWAFLSFLQKVDRVKRLYGFGTQWPEIQIEVSSNRKYEYPIPESLLEKLQDFNVQILRSDAIDTTDSHLVLDLAIKANTLTPSNIHNKCICYSVRNIHAHNLPFRLSYHNLPLPIKESEDTLELLESFLRDFFRKYALRDGQLPILLSVLAQKPTIGLLPTSAGKSICYQLAALLTPGTTIIIDPIVSLMGDQVQGLQELSRISRVFAWHAAAGVVDTDIGQILAGNLMVFMSPERLLRPNFRNAMNALNALDVFINYAVIDEAHCVSMWGHDFRPSYLSLDRNFKKFCTFQGHVPVTVALTGTASQLVLIDLKRELNISDMEAIVRPKTFDRPELSFSIIPCHNDEKYQVLQSVLRTLADRLGIPSAPENAWGIIYAYRPRELWELLGRFVGDANEHVQAVLTATGLHGIRFGVYCGKKPTGTTFSPREWGKYKAKTLAAFKRGDIRMLFGNAAVGVGIDNEKLNYIINYRMPQSIEAYYQQCGRAGRSGQPSPCFLIFSDNNPRATQQWLNGEIIEMDDRWDDLGTVSFFHRQSFPGREPDSNGALGVFMAIFDAGEPENGRAIINQIDDRTEHYLSYWLVLGVIEDYEVTGMADTTRYHVKLHQVIEEFMIHPNKSALQEHLLSSLYSYMSRYRPYTIEEVRTTFENQGTGRQLSERFIRTLIDFIYDRIAYQRREAIRTMVDFCNQEDTSPERLRQIIKSYFDESEKFTEILNKMAESKPAPDLVSRILKQVEGFDDVEHLYWETRRLLDERSRPDWALVNLYAMLFRERFFNDTCRKLLASAIEEMTDDTSLNDLAIESLLAVPLSFLVALEENGTSEPSAVIEILSHLYENYSTRFTGVISALSESEELVGFYSLALANKQIERVIYAARFEQIA